MLCFTYMKQFIPISEAAKILGVSIDTIRRWDKKGLIHSYRRNETGHRYYRRDDIEIYGKNLYGLALDWASKSKKNVTEPHELFYCLTTSSFQARLEKFKLRCSIIDELEEVYLLLTSVVGEIGNNSFDHNIGNWPDVPGIFFGYDMNKREIVIADRGQGILKTLQRVRPSLKTNNEAVKVAFTEIITGRAPESRGNGLKFVRKAIEINNSIFMTFQSVDARIKLLPHDTTLHPIIANIKIKGCLCYIRF